MLAAALFLLQSNFYNEGIKALEEKRYQAAVDHLVNAVAAEPKDYTAHFNLALAYSLLGRDADAIPEYKKTLELKPGLYQAELNLGISLVRTKQTAEAVPLLMSAAAQKPKEFKPNYYAGEALYAANDPVKAEPYFRAALEADPKSGDAEAGLALALASQTKPLDEAAPHFRKAAELDPNRSDSLLQLAALYEQDKRPAEAMAIYEQFPKDAGAQERLAELLLEAGKPAEAIPHFEAVIAKSPTAANRVALALAYLKNKQPDKALAASEQALASEPNSFELRMLHGRILRDDRKFAPATQDFLRAAQLKPTSVEAWNELASALYLGENYTGALAALDRIVALGAEKPFGVYLRAITLDKLHQVKPALASYQRFLSLSQGQSPDEEFKARQRVRILEKEIHKR
jgi:tetratricopeptide (TPR) repeat protein